MHIRTQAGIISLALGTLALREGVAGFAAEREARRRAERAAADVRADLDRLVQDARIRQIVTEMLPPAVTVTTEQHDDAADPDSKAAAL